MTIKASDWLESDTTFVLVYVHNNPPQVIKDIPDKKGYFNESWTLKIPIDDHFWDRDSDKLYFDITINDTYINKTDFNSFLEDNG